MGRHSVYKYNMYPVEVGNYYDNLGISHFFI